MKTDAQLREDIQSELAWDPSFDAANIGVIVKDGVVTVTGHLASFAEKYAVERAVQRVHGVKAVAVEIAVKLPFDNERTDADIATAAERALEWNVLVPDNKIHPMVEKGWLTLNGEVDWEYQRRAAEGAVRNLLGVRGVSNLVKVTPKVRPMVEKGWLTLNGEVDWDYQRHAAESAVRNLLGVRGVSNLVKVTPKVRPADVEKKIHDALARQAEREAKHVAVAVNGSQVTLRGKVHSWAERKAVQGAAWAAPGVAVVVNDLTVGN